MSLISKQIDELRAYAKDRKGELAKLINDAADTIEKLSAKLYAANMERSIQYYHDGWIPVCEKLPEKSGRYLATRGVNAAGTLWHRVYIVNYSDLMGLKSKKIFWIGNVGKSDFERLNDVIAWRPMPEPYKSKEKNNACD